MSRSASTWMCLCLAAALSAVGRAEGPAQDPAASDGRQLLHQTRQDVQKAWHESLTPPPSDASAELQKLIDEMRQIRVSPGGAEAAGRSAEPPAGPTTRPAAASPATMPAAALANRPPEPTTTAPAAGSGLSEKVIQQLKGLPASSLAHPVELADELYRGGYLKGALALYERALQSDPDPDTRAWATYQMANCQRDSDPAGAAALYIRVLAEHGSSPWASTAAVEGNLLAWMQSENPRALLASIVQIGRGPTTRPTTQPATRPTTYPAAGRARTAPAGKGPNG